MGFACMAPVVAARVFGAASVAVGTGAGSGALDDMAAWGARVTPLGPRELTVDRELRVVCCAAFTATQRIVEVFEGIDKMVRATLELAV
jgi:enhancing lycopene biosynthesis protein 2